MPNVVPTGPQAACQVATVYSTEGYTHRHTHTHSLLDIDRYKSVIGHVPLHTGVTPSLRTAEEDLLEKHKYENVKMDDGNKDD